MLLSRSGARCPGKPDQSCPLTPDCKTGIFAEHSLLSKHHCFSPPSSLPCNSYFATSKGTVVPQDGSLQKLPHAGEGICGIISFAHKGKKVMISLSAAWGKPATDHVFFRSQLSFNLFFLSQVTSHSLPQNTMQPFIIQYKFSKDSVSFLNNYLIEQLNT